MNGVVLMYLYFIGVQPPPIGLRVIVTDIQEAPQYLIDIGADIGTEFISG